MSNVQLPMSNCQYQRLKVGVASSSESLQTCLHNFESEIQKSTILALGSKKLAFICGTAHGFWPGGSSNQFDVNKDMT
jgi:hypothetical protein